MVDIRTSFAGLTLQSPIILSSSGLTRNIERTKSFVEAGAGAVILKSLFEEQILMQTGHLIAQNDYPEAEDYISSYVRSEAIEGYLKLIRQAKEELSVPVIASINCSSSGSWAEFAERIHEAGADALEINVMRLETDLYFDPVRAEELYVSIVSSLVGKGLPIIVKLSRYHTNLPVLVDKLRAAGAAAVTLFNRTYQIDIDLDREQLIGGEVFSHAGDFTETLRFTGLVRGLVPDVQISASTGVYTWEELTKAILAGADTTQMCTAVYKQGAAAIKEALVGLQRWMVEHGYQSLDELRGRLSYGSVSDPSLFERVQFMKYFSSRQG
ncbi:dihydroorotate dehydrogenase-like protein [uncultured Porphyromonas sp.]|uniref:dihydroorotate dehydrogenase-like protein n=1 Tax=uncultured Porphyromonas sp. TaxID=159274 RepID=UPI0026235E27|nr:dihydroorotate dehydrogenase-like protein [uncultured Porphyromonas sp.]